MSQYVAHEQIDPEGYRGTREQWAAYLRDTDWYRQYADECRKLNIPIKSPEDWIKSTLDACLKDADGEGMDLPELEY